MGLAVRVYRLISVLFCDLGVWVMYPPPLLTFQ